MKLKLLITIVCGVANYEVCGADLVEVKPNGVTGDGATVQLVVTSADESKNAAERAGSPATIVRNKGKGVQGLKPRDPNVSAFKKALEAEADLAGVPTRPLNLGDGTPVDSELFASERTSNVGGSNAGSPRATPKAADVPKSTEFSDN